MQDTNAPIIPQARPSPRFVQDARHVIANLEQFADRPTLRALAVSTIIAHRATERTAALILEPANAHHA